MFIGYRLLVIESIKFRVVESLALKVDSKICVFCETSNLEIYSAFMVIYFRMQKRVVLPYLRQLQPPPSATKASGRSQAS
jgi:hypothetical protein